MFPRKLIHLNAMLSLYVLTLSWLIQLQPYRQVKIRTQVHFCYSRVARSQRHLIERWQLFKLSGSCWPRTWQGSPSVQVWLSSRAGRQFELVGCAFSLFLHYYYLYYSLVCSTLLFIIILNLNLKRKRKIKEQIAV